MDEFLDLVKKLDLPGKGFNFLEELRDRTLHVCETGYKDLNNLMRELTNGIEKKINTPQDFDGLPILHFLRAHCHYVERGFSENLNLDRSKEDMKAAVKKFSMRNSEWNESIVHCYLGLLYYGEGNLDDCYTELSNGVQILIRLEKDCEETGRYDEFKKINQHRNKIENHIKQIDQRRSASVSNEGTAYQHQTVMHRLILQKQREQLQRHYNFLREQKWRIPPTLVAGLFYLYKTLAPSHHGVYREVPEPATDTEKRLYEELLTKIGFFEVIEQLLVLEEERNPTASRKELLEIIIQEWDKDIKQQSEKE